MTAIGWVGKVVGIVFPKINNWFWISWDFLWIKDKGYKIKCPLIGGHYDDTLQLIAQREYAIGGAIQCKQPEQAQDYVWFCDVCLCRQGHYDWMYHDKPNKGVKYGGHDICITCVYDMIKRYDQLSLLIQNALGHELTDDCIQVIVVYTGGNVVKL